MSSLYADLFQQLRTQFPALAPAYNDGYIFFDNAAGAQLPRAAINRVTEHLSRRNGQKGAIFARQEYVQNLVYETRKGCADLMGAAHDRVALGLNATSLTALAAHHLGKDLAAGDLILTSQTDHMANVWPWEEMKSRGVEVEMIPILPDGRLDLDAYRSLLDRRPKLVTCGWVSNATGLVTDLKAMAALAHEAGALIFADCVAGAPHLPMDVTGWDVDFAVCSGYKIFGPHIGFLYVNPTRLEGWRLGELVWQTAGRYGLGTSYAAKLELGTQNHEGLAGFCGTLEYLEQLGTAAAAAAGQAAPQGRRERLLAAMEAIAEYERGLTTALRAAVAATPGAIIYGEPAAPLISFNITGRRPADVASHLEAHRIEARVGNYLAIPQMTAMAADFEGEAVRCSLVHYNTPAEIERLAEVLQQL